MENYRVSCKQLLAKKGGVMTVKSNYVAPRVVEIGRFRRVTNGVWFDRWRDIYGGRAFIRVEVG